MIDRPYLLVMTLPCFLDDEGRRFAEELWHKDLVEHLSQIRDLTLAAPLIREVPTDRKLILIDPTTFEGTLRHVDLPPCGSMLRTLANLPRLSAQLWKAIGRADIVHANAGGWPISFGWIAIPMAKLRRKFTLTNVESGGWRLGFNRPWRFKPLLQAIAFESMARVIVNLSDLATFTHSGYRESMLLPRRMHRGHIVQASWIDRENILSRETASALWDAKLADPSRPLRVVFAANLLPTKGIAVLIEALKELERRGIAVDLDMYGKGVMLDECAAASKSLTGSVRLTMRGLLAYGEPFFRMLQEHDMMVVPSLSDEQPRVIYDCFARALPVIASNTPGVGECVTDGQTGKIVPIGDAMALADAIEWAARHRESLRDFGINALDVAQGLTHDQMHARRAELIESALERVAVGQA